ncbi:CGNR zinc finger domain-containing protein [Paenibacillus solisilvae]|uniref:CGNR zinc finger domain-containing protein n=1 Tax=Paenibacillus solisilvae TaxID=2486751 RepID=A0ABW0VUN2_9BACL
MEQPGFVFVGNHFAADFVNTRKNVKGTRTELLHTWDDLIQWLEQAGKLDVVTGQKNQLSKGEKEDLVQKILSIRNHMEQAFIDITQEKSIPESVVAYLNHELAGYRSYYQIEAQDTVVTAVRHYEISQLPALFLEEAARFLTTFKPVNLKKCENHSCILYFYDTSRNQQRRWCSMDKCGNRVKVNQHYHRKKADSLAD